MKFFKLHYIYIFNKSIITLTIFLVLFSMLLFFINGISIKEQNVTASVKTYNELISNYNKLIIIIITIIIVCNSFLSENDYYRIYLYNNGMISNKYIISKIVVLLSFIFLIILIEIFISNGISIILFNKIDMSVINNFINIIVLSIVYFSFSLLFIILFDYFYIVVLIFIIYLFLDSIEINLLLCENPILSIIVSIIFLLYSIFLYNKKDIII